MQQQDLIETILGLLQKQKISEEAAFELIQKIGSQPAQTKESSCPIAIIGYSARMPQSADLSSFWRGLIEGKNLIGSLPHSRKQGMASFLNEVGFDEVGPSLENWKAAFLNDVSHFASDYFGISEAEANLMDPAHRLFLEVVEETFQAARYSKERIKGKNIGVFAGNSGSNYMDALSTFSALSITGNLPPFLAARISFLYDLKGPAFSVQSTCSSSLLAVHLACQSLHAGECEMAVVGGAQIFAFPGHYFSEFFDSAGIMSPTQVCRPFDAEADGIGKGEAVIAFLLKPLEAARRDGDPIAAIILGSACNNDGRSAALSTPSPRAQSEVIRKALKFARVEPQELNYIEAHGTGTKLGDPIEIRGITDAFSHHSLPRQFCGVGSIKGNMGHALDGAAGLSSLLKMVLSLQNEIIPPSIHINQLNPEIDFSKSPVFPVIHPLEWKRTSKKRIGGVSCFSFNGTNVHMIVAEGDEACQLMPPQPFPSKKYHWLAKEFVRLPGVQSKKSEKSSFDLKKIWESILGKGAAEQEGHFFFLGGDSLKMMELLSQCKKLLGVDIAFSEFLKNPTYSYLNQLIVKQPDPVITKENAMRSLQLSDFQKTFWYLLHAEGDHPFYHVGKIFRLKGSVDPQVFQKIISQLIEAHESLRTLYQSDANGLPLITPGHPPLLMREIDCSYFPEKERDHKAYEMALREFAKPFSIETGHLFHTTLIKVREREYLWMVSMSHLVADLFSLNLFLEQFKTVFDAYAYGKQLPQVKQVTLAEIQYEEEKQDEAQKNKLRSFWLNELTPLPKPLALPRSSPNPSQNPNFGDDVDFLLSGEIYQKIKGASSELGVSSYSILLASVACFLWRFAENDDFIVGTESANRSLPHSHEWIWPRVNQLSVRLKPQTTMTFSHFAKDVQLQLSRVLEHQELPYHQLPDLLKLDRQIPHTQWMPVKVLMDPPSSALKLEGMETTELDLSNFYQPFPLVFRFSEKEGHFQGALSFQLHLFTHPQVTQWKEQWLSILNRVLTDLKCPLDKLKEPEQTQEKAAPSKPLFARKSLSLSSADTVSTKKLDPNWHFPLLIQPKMSSLHLDSWLKQNESYWRPLLTEHGALLFRDFGIDSVDKFDKVAQAIHPQKVEYVEPSQPRPEYKEKVYVSTEYPPDEILHQHSELNYTYDWPMIGLFCSLQPAESGGETPLADNREILARMNPSILKKFMEKGVSYQRNYGDGLLVPWQKVFKTENPEDVEAYCRQNAPMTFTWKPNGGLRTTQTRPGVIRHPKTHDLVWFNQSYLFHAGSLGESRFHELLKNYPLEDLPAHAYFGDGSPIEFEQLNHVYTVLRSASHSFSWQKGDVVVVDNILISHGRNPFKGARKTLACFVEPRQK